MREMDNRDNIALMHWRVGLLAGLLGFGSGCHRTPPSFGPNNLRTPSECAAIIADVRADTNPRTSPRAVLVGLAIPPLPVPVRVHGRAAEVWVPVDERGRVRVGDVRVTGIPDAEYIRKIQRAAAGSEWSRPTQSGCWVPGWGHLTFTF
jgi:hypothetical protein